MNIAQRTLACALLLPMGFALLPGVIGQPEAPSEEGVGLAARAQPSATEDQIRTGTATVDWASIREAYEAGRHAVFETEGGYQARNPGQQWLTRFDSRGFTVRPDAGGGPGGWNWYATGLPVVNEKWRCPGR